MHRSKLYLTILVILITVSGYSQARPKVARGKIDSNLNEGIVSTISDTIRTDFNDIELKSILTKEQLSGLEIVTGRIFFTGPGFPNVMMIERPCSREITNNTRNIPTSQCVNGSKVVFDNCIFRNKDQSLTQPVSKAYIVKMEEIKNISPRKRL